MGWLHGDDGEVLQKTRAELAQALLRIDGKPFSFENYPMFRDIYNDGSKSIILLTSRQVGKSTFVSNFCCIESIVTPHFRTLFVSPTQEQTHKFSTERVAKTIQYSPLIRKYFIGTHDSNRVFVRSFRNGSTVYFSYAQDDPDRVRGISADRVFYDEAQDISLECVVPVVNETLANSEYGYEAFTATPKSYENPIEAKWRASTMTEWAIKCGSCGRYSIIRSETQLTPDGPICRACKALLNPREGRWVDMHPNAKDVKLRGYHISRPIMINSVPAAWPEGPLRDKAKEKWADVWAKLDGPEAYPLSLFRNEVLGVSDSEGTRFLTREELLACCQGPDISPMPIATNMEGVRAVAVGIDWSGGGQDINSRTVIVVLGLLANNRIRLLYFKIFPGTSPSEEFAEIRGIIANYDRVFPVMVGGDAGEGNLGMDLLKKQMTNPNRIMKIRYVGTQGPYIRWSTESGEWHLRKTPAIDAMMTKLKAGIFQFPKNQAVMATPFQDILNEHVEVSTQTGLKRWTHAPSKPDDFLHALVFGTVALGYFTGEVRPEAVPI